MGSWWLKRASFVGTSSVVGRSNEPELNNQHVTPIWYFEQLIHQIIPDTNLEFIKKPVYLSIQFLKFFILSDTDQHNFKYSSFWCNVVGRDNNWWTFFLSSWLLQNNQIRHYPIQKRTHEHVFVAKIEDVNHLSIFLVWK